MEGIPNKARNLAMNLLLGKLYRVSRHSRAAVAIYKDCIRFVNMSYTDYTFYMSPMGLSLKDIYGSIYLFLLICCNYIAF